MQAWLKEIVYRTLHVVSSFVRIWARAALPSIYTLSSQFVFHCFSFTARMHLFINPRSNISFMFIWWACYLLQLPHFFSINQPSGINVQTEPWCDNEVHGQPAVVNPPINPCAIASCDTLYFRLSQARHTQPVGRCPCRMYMDHYTTHVAH